MAIMEFVVDPMMLPSQSSILIIAPRLPRSVMRPTWEDSGTGEGKVLGKWSGFRTDGVDFWKMERLDF